jgi:ABC-type proline/glycine betaine transport system permease subunit
MSEDVEMAIVVALALAFCVGCCSGLAAYQERERHDVVRACLEHGHTVSVCAMLGRELGAE